MVQFCCIARSNQTHCKTSQERPLATWQICSQLRTRSSPQSPRCPQKGTPGGTDYEIADGVGDYADAATAADDDDDGDDDDDDGGGGGAGNGDTCDTCDICDM